MHLARALALAAVALLLTPALSCAPARAGDEAAPARPDADRDGDGLTDFDEVHKYRTDPDKADSDGDGRPDGDWSERRESTYSLRFVVRALPPATAIEDAWQDARVLDRCPGYVEIEIVAYPLADPDADIPRTREREKAAAALPAHVCPNLTCDFDAGMRTRLLAALRADGIEPDTLSDRDLVERVSRWALRHSKFVSSGFCAQIVGDVGGRIGPVPGLEKEFQRRKASSDPKRTDHEQLAREVLGKEMFARRLHGACTSSAVYLATILRALGVPTLQTLAMPPADASDPAQVALLAHGIRNPAVRGPVLAAMRKLGGSNASHNFDLVFVGGRWRRLNYDDLGPPYVDARFMGLLLRLFEFDDLATSGIAPSWGRFAALGTKTRPFRGPNPYRLVDVTDRNGVHMRDPVPLDEGADDARGTPAGRVPHRLTVTRVTWMDRSAFRVQSGCEDVLLLHVAEWFHGQDGDQLQRFTRSCDTHFVLHAEGHPDITADCAVGSYTSGSDHGCALRVDHRALVPGVTYHLVPRNVARGFRWVVAPGVTVTR